MTILPIQKMLDFHPVIYCIINRNDQFVYVSATTANMLGYQAHELIGTPFLTLVVEQDRDKTKEVLRQLRQGRFIDRFENRYHHKNGSFVTLHWSSLWDGEEQLLYSIGHTLSPEVSVEQLQQALAYKLKQSDSKLSQAFDRITDGFFSLDDSWRFTYVNRATTEILGIPKESLLAHVLWEVFPKARGTIIEHAYKRCFAQQTPVRFETHYPHPLDKWFEVSAYPSDAGISVCFKDVTDRKNVEEEMRKLSLIVRHTDNLVLLCDTEGRIQWVNDAFEKKTGYTLAEASGKRPGDLLAGPQTDRQTVERLRAQYRKGAAFHAELLYYTKKKEKLWVDVTGRIIYDEAGNPKKLFSIQTDITERKLLEERLRQEREAHQRRTTMATIKAQEQERSEIGKELHDNVNQLLTTVKLYLEVSLRPEMNREELTQKSIQLLQETISEIRCLSKRLSAPTVEKISLSESIKELCDNVAITRQFKVTLDTSGIDELEVGEEVHLALYRILQEHLTNILKHAAAHHVMVNLDVEDGSVKMKVKDDGKGFDVNQKRCGIGITNMMTRAGSLNGKLSIKSALGLGTELMVTLPLA